MAESSQSDLDDTSSWDELNRMMKDMNLDFLMPQKPPSEDWHNDYLHKRSGQGYTILNNSELCKLGEIWISMFYTRITDVDSYVSTATLILALHLKNPVNLKELFSPVDQYPKFPTGSEVDPEKKEIKDNTGIPDFLASRKSIDVKKLKKENTPLYYMITGIKLMKVEEQAAFYSFLAAITCRLVSKSEGHVAGIWQRKAVYVFENFYRIPHANFVLSPPDIESFKFIKFSISPGSHSTVALYKAFLPAYSEACAESKQRVKGLLEFTFLHPTSMAGLQVITYVMKTARLEEISSLKEFSQKIHCNGTVEPMKTVTEFMEKYPLARPPSPDHDWWKWARNINVNSFNNLSLKLPEMRTLAKILMAFLATSENDDIWKAPSVSATKDEIRIIMQKLAPYKQSRNYAQRQSDCHFNIDEEFKSMRL